MVIYETLGRLYSRMHAVHNDWSGVWWDIPDKPLPSDYMYQAEIVGRSGKRALEQGRITQRTYDRAVALWAENLGYLRPAAVVDTLQPVPVEHSPGARRSRLACHQADVVGRRDVVGPGLRPGLPAYPLFGEVNLARWEAFLRGYGLAPERKRLLLYAVMQRFCSALGVYWEPHTARNKVWAASCLEDVESFLDEIERDRDSE